MIMRYAAFAILGILSLLAGCFNYPGTIRDIRELKQDHAVYLAGRAPESLLMDPGEQKERDREYNSRYFVPWHRTQTQYPLADITYEFEKYRRYRGYGENGRKHGRNWIKKLETNANLQNYPDAGYPAITIRPSRLRTLPTGRPHFGSSRQALSGHPFDNLQVSAVAVNTPVFISHTSRDKAWVVAETGYSYGWMKASDVASLSGDVMKQWESGNYAVILKDKTPLCDGRGLFLFTGGLGAMFPMLGRGEKGVEILTAVADADRHAILKRVVVSGDAIAAKPVVMTAGQMARLANELTDEPYGWGGLHGNRDCSSMLRDLFAPFGIWLPRHSKDQARQGGTFVDLSAISAEEKEKKIISEGIPYLTLLWRRGHIVLYIGVQDGQPLVFHNFWGISTRNILGRRGKMIVGRAAITTLHPGRELPGYDQDAADLTMNIQGMTLLAGRPQPPVR